jgi:hypothetical protein
MKKHVFFVALVLASVLRLSAQKAEVFNTANQAINGYDPVAYFTEGKAAMGNEKFTYSWHDANWNFKSKENLDLFMKNPERYAPQYGGYCAYGLSEGHKAPTDPNAWTIVEGKLYLNYNMKVRETWRTSEKERIARADKNWPGLKDKE